jgi:hypothetical protein
MPSRIPIDLSEIWNRVFNLLIEPVPLLSCQPMPEFVVLLLEILQMRSNLNSRARCRADIEGRDGLSGHDACAINSVVVAFVSQKSLTR